MKREKPDELAVPEAPNLVWSMDFMADRLGDGRAFRLLNVLVVRFRHLHPMDTSGRANVGIRRTTSQHMISVDFPNLTFDCVPDVERESNVKFNPLDDFNREGLAIEVDFSLSAERVIRSLDQIIEWRGKPQAIRVDNGPEYISGTLLMWAQKHHIRIRHIQPGKPQQNAYVERYNRTVRHEWLNQYIIETLEEAQEYATKRLWTYNNEQPNMGIGGITPAQKLKLAA